MLPRYPKPVYELFMPPGIRDSDGLWINGLCTFSVALMDYEGIPALRPQGGDVGGLTIDYITQSPLFHRYPLSAFDRLCIGHNKVIKPGDVFCPSSPRQTRNSLSLALVFAPVKSIHHIEIPSLQMTPHQDKGRHDDS